MIANLFHRLPDRIEVMVMARAAALTLALVFGQYVPWWLAVALGVVMVPLILWYLWRVVWRDTRPVKSHERSARLALVNLWELVAVYALLFLASGAVVENGANTHTVLSRPSDALYFSVVTMMTVGYGDFVPTGCARWIAIAQLATQAVFLFVLVPALLGTKRAEQSKNS